MSYIEREAAVKLLRNECVAKYPSTYSVGLTVAAKEISSMPSADVVEVVHCRDCKYWQDNNGGYPHEDCRWGKDETPDADDYCSFAERIANDGT